MKRQYSENYQPKQTGRNRQTTFRKFVFYLLNVLHEFKMAKSLILTYLLWLFGGGFGLHHFYLNRNIQGFLWLCLPGKF